MIDVVFPFLELIYTNFAVNAYTATTFSIAMAIYAIVVWHYYQILSKRDFFHYHHIQGSGFKVAAENALGGFLFILKYLILFPIITFILFVILSSFLFLLAKEQAIETIILISITVISATRIAAYYNEDLARDLAKLIPLALLGVFLVQPNFFSLDLFYERILALPSFQFQIGGFIIYTLVLEIVLKLLFTVKRMFSGGKEKEQEAPSPLVRKQVRYQIARHNHPGE
ncbi:MAG: hypothetical protein KKA90_00275 [Nanoarchaeota archaeon]|nr:hypothetical protein [Nanoarchaeota archaeon]